MRKFLDIIVCVVLVGIVLSPCCAQTNTIELEHPVLYTHAKDRASVINAIQNCEWKQAIVQKKIDNVSKYLELCEKDKNWLVSRLQMNWKTKHPEVFLNEGEFSHSNGNAPVPTVRFSGTRDWATDYRSPSLEKITPYADDSRGLYLQNSKTNKWEWVEPKESGHIIENVNDKIMNIATDASFLYWYTGEEKYAAFAAPIFQTYMEGMYHRKAPVDLKNSPQQKLSGLATFEVIHEKIVMSLALSYDFLYNYLEQEKYDTKVIAPVFQRWGDQIIQNGVPDNNWNFFQARFLTYIALILDNNESYENGKGKQYFLDHTFRVTSDRQVALEESILNYDQETGIWPECASYSMHVTSTLLKIITLLDGNTNENELKNYPIVEKATLASFQYLFPSGDVVGFGDSHHQPIPEETFEMLLTFYRKYNMLEKEVQITNFYNQLHSRKKVERNSDLFSLFFYVDKLVDVEAKETESLNLQTPTFYAPNVSWFTQRMGEGKNQTMVSTAGALGNHAHANGMAIEIFANNQVVAPEMGRGESYWHKNHRNFYARYPAHNTVVVNGVSDSRSMRVSQPFSLEAHYPKSGVSSSCFDKVTYAFTSFVEPATQANQQRVTATINTPNGIPYVFDLFRSETNQDDQFHDYFFHNIGQSLEFYTADNNIPLASNATNGLQTKGAIEAYNYFSNEKEISSDQDVKAQFIWKEKSGETAISDLWMKGGEERVYFSAMGPKSRAFNKKSVSKELYDSPIPTLVVRNSGEAWDTPFVSVLDMYNEGAEHAIESVEFKASELVGTSQCVKVKHKTGGTHDCIVVSSSKNDNYSDEERSQKGLLSITRMKQKEMQFLFLADMVTFEWGKWGIRTCGEPITISVEKKDSEYWIRNSGPVLFTMPMSIAPVEIEIYNKDGSVQKKEGIPNRNDATKMNYNLECAFDNIVIKIKR